MTNKRPMGYIAHLRKHWRRRFKCRRCIFAISSPLGNWKRAKSWSHKDAFCQILLKLAQWFWRSRFLYSINVFLLFRNYLPLEKCVTIHLNILESPSPKDAVCQVKFKLVVLEKKIFKHFVKVISLFRNNLPLEKGGSLHSKINWIIFTKWCFVPSLVEIYPVILKKIFIFLPFRYYLPLGDKNLDNSSWLTIRFIGQSKTFTRRS